MPSWLEWLVKERCLWHAEPMFDRDVAGHAMFRCPRCMATWPILADQKRGRSFALALPFDMTAVRARRQMLGPATTRALASGR